MAGRKRWFLVPPGALGPKYFSWSRVSHPLSELPEMMLRRQNGTLFEVTQRAGDLLFVPQSWGHATLNMCHTVALAQKFCGPSDGFCPLSVTSTLYGAAGDKR